MSEYQVTGRLAFRGHKPGTRFEAKLDPRAEARALMRGNIRLIQQSKPSLKRGTFALPAGWLNPMREVYQDG